MIDRFFALLLLALMCCVAALSIWLAWESYTSYQDLKHYEATRCERSKSGCE